MPDLWGFGAEDDRGRPARGHPALARVERSSGPAERFADLIERIGKLFG